MATAAFMETRKERLAQAEKLKKQYGFNPCGLCGMKVKVTRTSLKCDGWHWHSDCWGAFLKG